ncbi:hypothetical protein AXF42_Ash012257 [Apostasia shenzhenica]|uniref:Uncharacterized protein n=1 Tax=Apostasia shenzhenica TaxID=1088818 RepID=A0A2I0B4G6_9ASPA|nr:hypothetical protein AXF42_Ash012257 [Apostasia shenzhenica]
MVPASPGRADKLPAPGLARLLRGKGGSRSRSRSRSSLSRASPLFASRSRSVGRASAPPVDAGENGEPSSPKVTCIGQVRIRKKGKMWRGWPIGLRFEGNARHRQRMEPIDADPALTPPPAALSSSVWGDWGKPIAAECEREDADRTDSSTPPKNALILMRCRSAPHNRSSALSIRFGGVMEEEEEDEEEEARCPSSRPLFLKRCKSEPARMAAPEAANCSKNSGEELTVILKD